MQLHGLLHDWDTGKAGNVKSTAHTAGLEEPAHVVRGLMQKNRVSSRVQLRVRTTRLLISCIESDVVDNPSNGRGLALAV